MKREYGFLRVTSSFSHLSDPQDSKNSYSTASKWLAVFATLGGALKGHSSQQSLKQSLEALPPGKGLLGLERLLDQYVASCNGVLQRAKTRVTKASSEAWISWAKKRGASCRDQRSQAVLLKLLDDGSKFQVLKRYLDAYYAFSYYQARERLVDVVCRLRAVFNVGWFFEWPSGQHPLNSTWPWADVKPSLMVLWGVCWMFFPTYDSYSQNHSPWTSYQQPASLNLNGDMSRIFTSMRSSEFAFLFYKLLRRHSCSTTETFRNLVALKRNRNIPPQSQYIVIMPANNVSRQPAGSHTSRSRRQTSTDEPVPAAYYELP